MVSGGSSSPLGDPSIAETPAYVLALVLTFFLVVSLSFDYIVHALRNFFTRKKRPGLVEALDKVVSEVTLLGLVSLILTVIQEDVSRICIEYSESAVSWTMMHSYDGCPCCLEKTNGVTTCAQIYYDCPFNVTTSISEPYCGCEGGAKYSEDDTGECALLPPLETGCEGPFPQGTCSDGHIPAVSTKALGQMHLFVFLAAILHAVSAILVVLLASLRMRQWRHWQAEILKEDAASLELIEQPSTGTEISNYSATATVNISSRGTFEAPKQELGDVEDPPPRTAVLPNSQSGSLPAAEISPGSNTTPPPLDTSPSLPDHPSSVPVPADEEDQFTIAARDAKRMWMRRSTLLLRKRSRVAEVFVCIAQSFYPNMISRTEFRLMRESYLASHGLAHNHDFLAECNQQLDRNCGSLVGLSLEMWLVWIVTQLLMGAVDWANNLILILGALCLFIMNIILVAMVRYACRGGRVHDLRPVKRWYANPKLMAIPMRSLIFLCSLILSSDAFFAWQMGPKSCFFIDNVWNEVSDGLAWWVGLILSGILLTWTAIVTVPAWTMCLFTRLDEDSSLVKTQGGREGGGREVEEAPRCNCVAEARHEQDGQVAGA